MLLKTLEKDADGNNILIICDYLINKKIKFVYLLNYTIKAYSKSQIIKFNFWCKKMGKDYIFASLFGFLGGSKVPIIIFDRNHSGRFTKSNFNMDFHISSSDNI